ncbi:MAG: A/G-specific adenine glycosylase [Chitinophagales bacterium]
MSKRFARTLLHWYAGNRRNLPWVGVRNPYLVWLSEMILQQTRVEQGIPYYERFIKAYPTVHKLAAADPEEVMKMWEGLGYYSRARNLHAAAKQVVAAGGKFPTTLEGLKNLKGVGPYSAAAIMSYAYNAPHAVVDANVVRILARIYNIQLPFQASEGKKAFTEKANALLDAKEPANFNQAMMDLGALVCTPRDPKCGICPFRRECHAAKQDATDLLPVKTIKAARKKRYFHFLVIRQGAYTYIMQRKEQDIWNALWQFPLIETPRSLTAKSVLKSEVYAALTVKKEITGIAGPFKQLLTHREIICTFFIIDVAGNISYAKKGWKKVKTTELKKYAFPGAIRTFLQRNVYF